MKTSVLFPQTAVSGAIGKQEPVKSKSGTVETLIVTTSHSGDTNKSTDVVSLFHSGAWFDWG
jgi:hypothetical protein